MFCKTVFWEFQKARLKYLQSTLNVRKIHVKKIIVRQVAGFYPKNYFTGVFQTSCLLDFQNTFFPESCLWLLLLKRKNMRDPFRSMRILNLQYFHKSTQKITIAAPPKI